LGTAFIGKYRAQFDAKQRVALPAKLRRDAGGGAGDSFVLTLGLDGCLFLFTQERFDRIMARLEEVSFTGEKAKHLTRQLLSNASRVETDTQARILVPQELIQKAKLEKEVLFVGALNRIEIWRPEAFEKYLQERPETYEQVAGEFLL
jgi:MraZ protein